MFITALNSMLVLFLCMVIGYAVVKAKAISVSSAAVFSSLLLNVTVPALIIKSMIFKVGVDDIKVVAIVFVIALFFHLFGLLLGLGVTRIFKPTEDKAVIWVFMMTFANVGYMGYPVIGSIYGDSALFYVTIVNLVFNILVPTLGIKLMSKGSSFDFSMNNLLKSPPILATMFGLVILVCVNLLPSSINDYALVNSFTTVSKATLNMVGAITSPLAMIVVGINLTRVKFGAVLKDWTIYVLSFLRLIVIPVLVFFIASIFISDSLVVAVITLLSGMPAAALTVIFAISYNKNDVVAAELVFVSTVLSILTIPIIVLLIERF